MRCMQCGEQNHRGWGRRRRATRPLPHLLRRIYQGTGSQETSGMKTHGVPPHQARPPTCTAASIMDHLRPNQLLIMSLTLAPSVMPVLGSERKEGSGGG